MSNPYCRPLAPAEVNKLEIDLSTWFADRGNYAPPDFTIHEVMGLILRIRILERRLASASTKSGPRRKLVPKRQKSQLTNSGRRPKATTEAP